MKKGSKSLNHNDLEPSSIISLLIYNKLTLEGFSHLILLYHFHLSAKAVLKVKPFLDKKEHGLFATRAPVRPKPIGFSVVKLKRVIGNVLYIEDVDIVHRAPLLDMKPYVPVFNARRDCQIGWLESCLDKARNVKDDGKFLPGRKGPKGA
ncbi:MAG TPA: SAM-dependent methyltransferase [Spirochaetes bacterium]|nr:SAM-dependent methyltransferase [Spirochaetota bacterium]